LGKFDRPGTNVTILAKKMPFYALTAASICKNLIVTMVFVKNDNCLPNIGVKIAEIGEHNIDPRMHKCILLLCSSWISMERTERQKNRRNW
jgi:hypothetical protein